MTLSSSRKSRGPNPLTGVAIVAALLVFAATAAGCSVDEPVSLPTIAEQAEPTVEATADTGSFSFLDNEIGDTGLTPRMLNDPATPVSVDQFQGVVDADGDNALWFVFGRAEQMLQGDWSLRSAESLPEHLRVIYGAVEIWAEVENGGFPQYFFNGMNERWPVQRAGLERLGFAGLVDVSDQAHQLYERELPAGSDSTDDMDSLLEVYASGEFDALDDAFYVDSEGVHQAVVNYIDENLVDIHGEIFG